VREVPPPSTFDVDIESLPAGAQIMIGGTVLGTTPFRRALLRRNGEIAIVVRLSGYADKTLIVRGDQAVSERVTLVVQAAPPSRTPDRNQSVNPFAR
jgi:hypothetical protein